jgi:hypothetical protein
MNGPPIVRHERGTSTAPLPCGEAGAADQEACDRSILLWKAKLIMAHVLIHCPRTGSNVHVWIPETTSADRDSYEDVRCPACLRLHFVNKITGELLGEQVASEGLIPAQSSTVHDPLYDPIEIDAGAEED